MKVQHHDHWSNRLNRLSAKDSLLRPSKALPKPGQMLFASQRPIPSRDQMGPTPSGPPESPYDEPRSEFHARQETPESGIGTGKDKGDNV